MTKISSEHGELDTFERFIDCIPAGDIGKVTWCPNPSWRIGDSIQYEFWQAFLRINFVHVRNLQHISDIEAESNWFRNPSL